MILKLVALAACLSFGAFAQEENKATIFQALHEGDEYLLLWSDGSVFVLKCAYMVVISTSEENRTIFTNVSTQSSFTRPLRYWDYYFKTYKNGSSFARTESPRGRWRHHYSNYRMNYTSQNKSCFVVRDVTKSKHYTCPDADGCEVWINKEALVGSSAECPVSLDTFEDCISRCPKPQVPLKRLSWISYHPNCTYPAEFKPVMNGTWQEDLDKEEQAKEEARRLEQANRDEEEAEDDDELEEEKKQEAGGQ